MTACQAGDQAIAMSPAQLAGYHAAQQNREWPATSATEIASEKLSGCQSPRCPDKSKGSLPDGVWHPCDEHRRFPGGGGCYQRIHFWTKNVLGNGVCL